MLFLGFLIFSDKLGKSNDDNNDINIIDEEMPIEDDKVEEYKNKDIFSYYYKEAEELMKTMSLEEKVGQMFLVRYPETKVIDEIKSENPGGYILFARDFKDKTKDNMINELTNVQNVSKIKLLLGVDEEGGRVTRVSSYKEFRSSKFDSQQDIYRLGGIEKILEDSREKSDLLKSIGLNMNLAPVVDIPKKQESFIYSRTLGVSASETADYAYKLIEQMNKDKMISSMKHFPGYGDNVDTHTGIAVDTREYSTFENEDFLPFISGIQAGAPTILVNHNIVNCMDDKMPSSLSANVHEVLRNNLNFSGLIITDDLAMGALKEYVENGSAATQAVLAGNDMIITSDFKKQKTEVLDSIKNGQISEEMINNAVKRILACKYYYNII